MVEMMTLLVVYMAFFFVCLLGYFFAVQCYGKGGICGACADYLYQACFEAVDKALCEQRTGFYQIHYLLMLIVYVGVLYQDILPNLIDYYGESFIFMWIPVCLVVMNVFTYMAAAFSDPGYMIGGDNYKYYANVYEYDKVLYKPNKECRTCKFRKPARSKHCAFCDLCVWKFDHHCVWLNNCIGGLNKRNFISFLLSLSVMFLWFSYFYLHYIYSIRRDLPEFLQVFFEIFPTLKSGEDHKLRVTFVSTTLAILTSVVVPFTTYHIYLIVSNQTTNERFKIPANDPYYYNFYDMGLWPNLYEIFFPFDYIQLMNWEFEEMGGNIDDDDGLAPRKVKPTPQHAPGISGYGSMDSPGMVVPRPDASGMPPPSMMHPSMSFQQPGPHIQY